MTNNLPTIYDIADRCEVHVGVRTEAGRRVIELYGRRQDIEKVLDQIHGYHFCWAGCNFGDPPPEHPPEEILVLSLYSGRTDWAEAESLDQPWLKDYEELQACFWLSQAAITTSAS